MTIGKITHCSIDLDWIVHRGGSKYLASSVRFPGAEDFATESEVIAHAAVLKARGFEALPTCGNYDRLGNCRGCGPRDRAEDFDDR